ncbi:hypothetical protein BJX99DRAFT_240845 [Aspergillus californicus]
MLHNIALSEMDISFLLNNSEEEPTAYGQYPLKSHNANAGGDSNQHHFAVSLSRVPQSVPFPPLLPKPPGSSGAGAQFSIPGAPTESSNPTKYSERNQIAWLMTPGGWPGPCLLHPPQGSSRVKDKTPFSPEEDAAMIYMLENLCGSRRELLRAILGRSYGNIGIRRDELYAYRYCNQCLSCCVFMQRLFMLKDQYQGARWWIGHEFSDGQIDILVPPPCQIRSGETFPLPVVARVRGKYRDLSLSVTFGGSSVQWSYRTISNRSDRCYIFLSRVLRQPGSWTLRLFSQDTSEFSVGFEISCVGSIHTGE